MDFLKFQPFAVEHKEAGEEPSIPKQADNEVGVRMGREVGGYKEGIDGYLGGGGGGGGGGVEG